MEWDQDTSLARYERVTQINTTVILMSGECMDVHCLYCTLGLLCSVYHWM